MKRAGKRGPAETFFLALSALVVMSMILGTVLMVLPAPQRRAQPTETPTPTVIPSEPGEAPGSSGAEPSATPAVAPSPLPQPSS